MKYIRITAAFFIFSMFQCIVPLNDLMAKGLRQNQSADEASFKAKDYSWGEKECFSGDTVTAFRFRSDFDSRIDGNLGWSAPINEIPDQTVDTPFRLRFEIESDTSTLRRQYSLQYRWNDGQWCYVETHEFPYPSAATPPVSIVSCDAFFYGEAAGDLLAKSALPAASGAGISLAPTTPGWIPKYPHGETAEFEWALVVRRWADGPELVKDGDQFSIRMVDQKGLPLPGPQPEFIVKVPSKHLGGTFVETPSRIGPFEDSLGYLYFIMEPTETDPCFMMVKSIDHGKSWVEVDPENRPRANDLEGVGAVMSSEGIIHIVHQKSHDVYYHSFATADNQVYPDQWITDSYLIADTEKPPVQTADIALRPDGSIVTVYGAGPRLQLRIREKSGAWLKPVPLDPGNPNGLTSPSLICRPDGVVDIAYKSTDGKGWCRQLLPDNTFTKPQKFTDDLGTTENEAIAILPLVYLDAPGTTLAVFRQSDGYLYGSFRSKNNEWAKPFRISDRPVVTNAVDSDQPGADVVVYGDKIYIAFISQDDRDIYFSALTDFQTAPAATKIVPDINGSWVRGQILMHQPESPCYGIIYDAGSKGGSGYNKYLCQPLIISKHGAVR
ncbi:MAG: exo-alpha-sialidase [Bacteroidota bacterium]